MATASQDSCSETQSAQHSRDQGSRSMTPTTPSPDEIRFDEAVRALLSSNHTHAALKSRLHALVSEEATKLPPIKVVYCTSYGGFGYSEDFENFRRKRRTESGNQDSSSTDWSRHSPSLLQDISDYGRFLCKKYPFILNDMQTARRLRLSTLLAALREKKFDAVELGSGFAPNLVAKARAFVVDLIDPSGFGSFPKGGRTFGIHAQERIDLEAFIECHPDFWMSHVSLGTGYFAGPTEGQFALRFAHILLQEDFAMYHVDEQPAVGLFDYIGLCGAGTSGSRLAIKEVPALIDYTIREYDGKETVKYHS